MRTARTSLNFWCRTLLVVLPAAAFPAKALRGQVAETTIERRTLVPIERLGTADGPLAFNAIVAIVQRGQMLVLAEASELLTIDTRTKKVQRFGRRGHGPGEFQDITDIGYVGDTLWVADRGLQRITFFRPDRRVLTTVTFVESLPVAPLSDGSVLATSYITPGEDSPIRLLRYTRQEVLKGTLLSSVLSAEAAIEVTFGGGGRIVRITPFPSFPFFVLHPFGGSPAVIRRDGTMGKEVAIEWKIPDVRLDVRVPAQRISEKYWEETIREGVPAAKRSTVNFPISGRPESWVPIVTGLMAANGDVWLARKDGTWLVVNRTRGKIAEVTVPPDVQLRFVQGEIAWGTSQGEDDVPVVVRMEMRKR